MVQSAMSLIAGNGMYLSGDYEALDKDGNVMGNKGVMNANSRMLNQAIEGSREVVQDVQEEEDGSV
jgi:hypothetical protein